MGTLLRLVEELQSTDDEEPTYVRIRALAAADLAAFLAEYDAPDLDDARSDVLEAFTLGISFEPAWEPVVDHALQFAIAAIKATADPPLAARAAAALWPLGELDVAKVGAARADRWYDVAVPLLAHAEPEVRVHFVELVACWSRAGRVGSRDPVAALLVRDPDPKVRDAAYRALADWDALPAGAVRPWSPDTFRAIRRWFASI